MKSFKDMEEKGECDVLPGWRTSQALGQHGVSFLAVSVSWAAGSV